MNFIFACLYQIDILIIKFTSFLDLECTLTKHCSSDHNTSCDLEFDKNVPRLVTTGAINLKKKQSEGNTLLCYEYLFYINTQMLTVHCVSTGNILPEFFFQATACA